MKQEKQIGFKLDRFLIQESHIVRRPIDMGSFSMDIDPSGVIDDGSYTLQLDVIVKDSNESFYAKISAIGIFIFNSEERLLNDYFYTNAPAIMYPYIRAYVSSLTALSGLPAVNLPVAKFAYTEKLKAQTTNTSDLTDKKEGN